MDELEKIRDEINATDDQVLRALAARRELARRIIQAKALEELPLRDERREEDLLARLIQKGREMGLDAHLVTRVFHEIIDDSVRFQQIFLLKRSNDADEKLRRVAYQGVDGAFSHLAAQKFFSRSLDLMTFIGHPSFSDAVEAVEGGAFDFAFLPIENTTAGSIHEVYDLLSRTSLSIVGEEVFRVEHCLLGVKDVPLSSLRRILSHWQALAQCRKFLFSLPHCQGAEFEDTALAARKVKEDQDPTQAAIASEDAARRYGLKILKRDLADQKENFTRFLVIAREPVKVDLRIPAKTSLVLAVAHEEGALLGARGIFHKHKINLTKLESRPMLGSPFQYLFYLDFEGNRQSEEVRAALEELRKRTSFLKILGTYAIEWRGRTAPSTQAIVPPRPNAASTEAGPSGPPAEP
ncbi:MAG TPA: prephenate dehydratase, partial [Planctomycetota bacterium]|nr:prephenate dehydratase [Planctomycetota bacterium]